MMAWLLNAIEWAFMPQTWHERQRLDPVTRAFKERMRAFNERGDQVVDPKLVVGDEENDRRDAQRGEAALRVLLCVCIVVGSLLNSGSGCSRSPTEAAVVVDARAAGFSRGQWTRLVALREYLNAPRPG